MLYPTPPIHGPAVPLYLHARCATCRRTVMVPLADGRIPSAEARRALLAARGWETQPACCPACRTCNVAGRTDEAAQAQLRAWLDDMRWH